MFSKDIQDTQKWKQFLEYKQAKEYVNNSEKNELKKFIENYEYEDICKKLSKNEYTFSIPKRHLISKGNSRKKRIVYTFEIDEMIVLKYVSFLLYDYDFLFSKNLYSFRKNTSVKCAIKNMSNIRNIHNMYGYKVDISNYFNSIDTDILLNNLKNDIKDDLLYSLFFNILSNDKVLDTNKSVISEKKGVMAGTPISAFLANYYIKEIDEYFWNEKLVYFRYADDIIIFASDFEVLKRQVNVLKNFFVKFKLDINKDKEYFFMPHSDFEFLGFSFNGGKIDISKNALRKIKGKIRRSARAIRRWQLKKNAKCEVSLKAMNRKFNKKFFGKENKEELSWKYWFFPTITTTDSLKIIDKYMQDYLRYIVTRKT